MDTVDFRVSETLAIGHDSLNVIVFRKEGKPGQKGRPQFDGASWRAVSFIYKDKRVLLRCLRELGWKGGPERCPRLASMCEDLRTYRLELNRTSPASQGSDNDMQKSHP